MKKNQIQCFDMESAIQLESEYKLKNQQTLHRLFKVIASDFYKPIRATEIFSLVFPNEYFDPVISINRVHQAIKRLRGWMDECEIPLEIVENKNTYYLKSTMAYKIRWTEKQSLFDKNYNLNNLFSHFQNNVFSLVQASEFLNTSERSTSRLLKKAVEDTKLIRLGGGATTRYHFAKK